MVRFKNRYLLIQLHPFRGDSDVEVLTKKRRYIDSEIDSRGHSNDGSHGSSNGGINGSSNGGSIESSFTSTTIPCSSTSTSIPSASTTAPSSRLSFDPASVVGMLRHELEVNFGLQGSASLSQSLTVKYTNTATGMVILRCPRDHLPKVLSTVAWCSNFPQGNVEGLKCTWRVVHCAGTIKACQQAAIAFAKREGKLTLELTKKLTQLNG